MPYGVRSRVLKVRRVAVASLAAVMAALVLAACAPAAGGGRTSTAAALPPMPSLLAGQPSHSPLLIHHVVALGDSVPAGSACSCTSYVALVATEVAAAQHRTIKIDNLSAPGRTTAGLVEQLGESSVTAALSDADMAIVTIGANDLEDDSNCSVAASVGCYQPNLRALQTAYAQMLERLHAALPARARIFVTGYWNVFLGGAVARRHGASYVRNSATLTKMVNGVIASDAAAGSAIYVDVYRAFKGDGDRDDTNLLADDGDHPNAAGHVVIAEAINAAWLGS